MFLAIHYNLTTIEPTHHLAAAQTEWQTLAVFELIIKKDSKKHYKRKKIQYCSVCGNKEKKVLYLIRQSHWISVQERRKSDNVRHFSYVFLMALPYGSHCSFVMLPHSILSFILDESCNSCLIVDIVVGRTPYFKQQERQNQLASPNRTAQLWTCPACFPVVPVLYIS